MKGTTKTYFPTCAWCGNKFETKSIHRKYCNDECKKAKAREHDRLRSYKSPSKKKVVRPHEYYLHRHWDGEPPKHEKENSDQTHVKLLKETGMPKKLPEAITKQVTDGWSFSKEFLLELRAELLQEFGEVVSPDTLDSVLVILKDKGYCE